MTFDGEREAILGRNFAKTESSGLECTLGLSEEGILLSQLAVIRLLCDTACDSCKVVLLDVARDVIGAMTSCLKRAWEASLIEC